MANDDKGAERGGSKSGAEEPDERTDGWMATYADMVTLLMTFFVLMFAISNVDTQKAALLFAALSRDGLTPELFLELQPEITPDDPWAELFPSHTDDPRDTPEPSDPTDEPGGDIAIIGNEELEALATLIADYINENGLGDRISLMFDGEFLLLTLVNDIWFVSVSADVTAPMKENAIVIAGLLADTFNDDNPFVIVVEGHTDNRPINTARFPSNWHVSVFRAVNFMDLLRIHSGIDPYHFQARGCGENHPIATNDTAEGRQLNRRVEVKISFAARMGGELINLLGRE